MASKRKNARYIKRNEREVLNTEVNILRDGNNSLSNELVRKVEENESLDLKNIELSKQVKELLSKLDKFEIDAAEYDKRIREVTVSKVELEEQVQKLLAGEVALLDSNDKLSESLEEMIDANQEMEKIVNELGDELDLSNKQNKTIATIYFITVAVYIVMLLTSIIL